jgi:glycosyltransferase involved in cell wall biosynthesis
MITGLEAGGAERELADIVRLTRHEVEVVGMSCSGVVGDQIAARGVRVHDLRMTSNTDVTTLPRLAAVVRRGRFDVVHTHLIRASIYGGAAARLARVPLVLRTEHGLGETQLEARPLNRAVRGIYRATDPLFACTVAVSEVTAGRVRRLGIPQRKIRVIPNGIELDDFRFSPSVRAEVRRELGAAADAPVIGTVGRLEPLKRHDLLMRSVVPLLERGGRLVLAGEGADRGRLEALAAELGVADRVSFLGAVADPARVLNALDVFAGLSAEETFGMAAVEAVANGLPTVLTACPALQDVPDAGVVWVSGDVDSVRTGIEQALRQGRSEATRPAVERYAMEHVVEAIDALYEELS